MSIDSLTVSLIDEFLADYESPNLGRPMISEERALAEEVLFDFIVTDLSTDHPPQCAEALAGVRALIAAEAPDLIEPISIQLGVIERAARRMSCQMQRREKSFDIMRENLVMLSERTAS